jgi:acetylornithine deacetylase/succinyl-diaminopimelate desuccinylase family protein
MTAELLRDLVRIPSVNPDGDPGTEHVGEARCAEFLAAWLREIGAEVSLDEVLPGRPNVVARFPAERSGKPRLLLAPHTDTVSVVGMTIDPFGGEIRDGKLWGRGASDTKGPMAAMLVALKNCRDILPSLSHEIWFAGLVGEEAGQHGAKALAAKEKFDLVIVGEPTGLQAVHTHKGAVWLTLRTAGHAVHASTPERGENAIEKMLDVLQFLRPALADHVAPLSHPVLGKPTFNLGTITGGSKVNIVPDRCEVKVDMRTLPGQDVQPLVDTLAKKFPSLQIDLRNSAPLFTDPAHPVITKLGACGALPVGAPWFCDGAIFAEAGSPAIALGPGSIAQAHIADEWISLEDLEAGTAFFEKFLKELQEP